MKHLILWALVLMGFACLYMGDYLFQNGANHDFPVLMILGIIEVCCGISFFYSARKLERIDA